MAHWTLPSYLQNAIESPIAAQRRSAVDGLAYLHRVGNEFVRTSVARHLTFLADDDGGGVSAGAPAVLQGIAGGHEPAGPAARPSPTSSMPPKDEAAGEAGAQGRRETEERAAREAEAQARRETE